MSPGQRCEILVAVINDARWIAGTIESVCIEDRELFNVHADDGRYFRGVHPSGMRAIVTEAA